MLGHGKAGRSFEGFAMQTVVEQLDARPHECSFWALHSGAELDLLIARGTRRVGFEFKLGSAPDLTPSMRSAIEHLALERLWVVHHGKDRYRLADRVEAVPMRGLQDVELWGRRRRG